MKISALTTASGVWQRQHGRSGVAAWRWIVALCSLPLSVVSANLFDQCPNGGKRCEKVGEKTVYRVGVLAIRGKESAREEFETTFSDYLTLTAGARFNPPLTFEMKPLNFSGLFDDTERQTVDFVFVNPSAYSCIESEYGAQSLVSQISRRVVGGKEYSLTKFGGVIIARADNDKISTVHDIRGKRVACASISGLGSGQMQFRLMQQKGLSYINDPSQLVFTSHQGKVVNGVLKGYFDVGFVRTDQMERTIDDLTGELVDLSKLKIIEPQEGLSIDGKDFPFESSTPLYPEWNVAALSHVREEVAAEVQQALLRLHHHAKIAGHIRGCYEVENCTYAGNATESCKASCNEKFFRPQRDTCHHVAESPEVSLVAAEAKDKGNYMGWRFTFSYMELRNMQEDTSFIRKDPDTGTMRCIRSSSLYDAIACPSGFYKRSERDVENGCEAAGLTCEFEGERHQCLCSPCSAGMEYDIFASQVKDHEGCSPGFWKGCAVGVVFGLLAGCLLIHRPGPSEFEGREESRGSRRTRPRSRSISSASSVSQQQC